MSFSDDLLQALNGWQKGWREDQDKREELSVELLKQCEALPQKYKSVDGPCFRKRFLHKEELIDIIMADEKHEGVVSWTTDERFAERFKGLLKDGAVTGAIFKITPEPSDVVVNIASLWNDQEFVDAVNELSKKDSGKTDALIHFKADQSEVVLKSKLCGSDIIALTGVASPFDMLCDQAGIPESIRDGVYKKLIDSGEYIDEPRYTPPGRAQAAIKRAIEKFNRRIIELSNTYT